MTHLTLDVVRDLWPLYAAGELSPGTRALVDAFLEQDPELARRLQDEKTADWLSPVPVDLPPDHERETLIRLQRRRATQSMIINAAALLASAVLTAICLWTVVPQLASAFARSGVALPAATRLTLTIASWIVRLTPPVLFVLVLMFRRRTSRLLGRMLRRHPIQLPDPLRSGTAVAAVTAVLLFLVQAAWLSLLVGVTRLVADVR